MLKQNLVEDTQLFYGPEVAFHQLFHRELGSIAISKLVRDLALVIKKQAVFASIGQKM